ncbi:hypothetical protein PGTUg99_020071 [Puccinia graminis f. sp. tritici]|uniref:Uncharacterized protein n=1 Tax=Puccinia graminis f. sp. tritici TaxID=56615 RepID=A0A5B0MR45_PUCGR|nr:hypothetical protein PGTUg99_020071 [Puccinia graminis f. sp. tritici]
MQFAGKGGLDPVDLSPPPGLPPLVSHSPPSLVLSLYFALSPAAFSFILKALSSLILFALAPFNGGPLH